MNKSTLLLVTSNKNRDKVFYQVKKIKKSNNYNQIEILALNLDPDELKKKIEDPELNVLSIENYINFSKSRSDKPTDSYNFVNLIKKTALADNSIYKFFTYKDINLLDLVEVEFHLYFVTKVLKQFNIAYELIENVNPDKIIIFDTFDPISFPGLNTSGLLCLSLELIAKTKNIPVVKKNFFIPASIKNRILNFVLPYLRILRDTFHYISVKDNFTNKLDKDKKTIVFLSHCSASAKTLIPVINKLKDYDKYNLVVIQTGSEGKLEFINANIKFFRLEKFYNMKILFNLLKSAHILNKNIVLLDRSKWLEKIDYNSFKIGTIFREVFNYFFAFRFFAAITYIEIVENILEQFNPVMLIATLDRNARERTAFLICKNKNVRTLLIQTGLYSDDDSYKFPIFAEKMAVEGEAVKKILVSIGHSSDKFLVTGQPAYELLLTKYKYIKRSELFEKYGLDSSKKIVLYASQNIEEEMTSSRVSLSKDSYLKHRDEIYAIYKAFSGNSKVCLVVKPHPKEDESLHFEVFQSLENNQNIKIVSKKSDIYELISICDLLITRHSTAGLEALAFGKPIMIVNLLNTPDVFPYVQYGAAIGVNNKDDIYPVAYRILYDYETRLQLENGTKSILQDFLSFYNGSASERISKFITSMV